MAVLIVTLRDCEPNGTDPMLTGPETRPTPSGTLTVSASPGTPAMDALKLPPAPTEMLPTVVPAVAFPSSSVSGATPRIDDGAPVTLTVLTPLLEAVMSERSISGGVPRFGITTRP